MGDDDNNNNLGDDKNLLEHAKDGIDKAANTAKKATKIYAALSTAITVITHVLPIVIIVLAAGSIIYTAVNYFLEVFDWSENTPLEIYDELEIGDTTDLITIEGDASNGYYYSFKDELLDNKLEEIIKTFAEDTNYIKFEDKEYLKKLLQTDLQTRLPDLGYGKVGSNTNISGALKLRRVTPVDYENFTGETTIEGSIDESVGASQTIREYGVTDTIESVIRNLKYIEPEDFSRMVDEKDNNVLKYFTIDENDQIVIAIWYQQSEQTADGETGSSETEYETQTINYNQYIQKYTMPFEYLIDLLIDGKEDKFVEELADYALESHLILAIQDNISKDTVYVQQKSQTIPYTRSGGAGSAEPIVIDAEYESLRMLNDVPVIELTFVKAWYVTAMKENSYYQADADEQKGEARGRIEYEKITTKSQTEIGEVDWDKPYKQQISINGILQFNLDGTPKMETITPDTGHRTDTWSITTETTLSNTYESGEFEIRDDASKFLELYDNSEEFKSRIKPKWLFAMLERNPKTANLVDVTKYLLYEATGINYGISELILEDINNLESFNDVSSTDCLWNGDLTREEFIELVNNFVPPDEINEYTGKNYRWGYETFFKPNAGNFYDIATSYGFDPRFIFSMAIHESKYGTSEIALDKGNFFGWGAYDGSAYESAITFYNMSDGIEAVCSGLKNNYVTEGGMWYQWIIDRGYNPATIEGIGARYAGDPNWAKKVKKFMNIIFKYQPENGIISSINGENLNDDNGEVNIDEIISLQENLEKSFNLIMAPKNPSAHGSASLTSKYNLSECQAVTGSFIGYSGTIEEEDGSMKPIGANGLGVYQCTWWANGRASMYLSQNGTKYKQYPTAGGNGGDYYNINRSNGYFNYGSTPKPNSLAVYVGSKYGHVAYVEAVDYVNKKYYISHAGSGERWYGIWEMDFGEGYGGTLAGYIYLDEPL